MSRSLNAETPYNPTTAPDGFRKLNEITKTVNTNFRLIENILIRYFEPEHFSLICYLRSNDIVVCVRDASGQLDTIFEISKTLKKAQIYGYSVLLKKPQYKGLPWLEKAQHINRAAIELGLDRGSDRVPFGTKAGLIKVHNAKFISSEDWKTLLNIAYA